MNLFSGNRSSVGDRVVKFSLASISFFIVLVVLMIAYKMFMESLPAIKTFGLKFFVSSDWNPVSGKFGALSSIYGTLMSTLIAIIIAVPVGVLIALFLVEYSPPVVAVPVSYAIELLAAIPSIIYGMWGLFILAPLLSEYVISPLKNILGWIPLFSGKSIGGQSVFTAGVIIAVMILPYITAIMRDVFKMVPASLKESAYGIGATSWEVSSKVTIPFGISGLLGAIFLSLGRALGETMAVTFVIGNAHRFNSGIFTEGNTISSTLANEFGEADSSLFMGVLMELGLILFILSLLVQAMSWLLLQHVAKKQRGLK